MPFLFLDNILEFVYNKVRLSGFHSGEHIVYKYAIPRSGVVDHHVCHRTDELAVLDDGRAAHECVQVGTTVFNKKFKSQKRKQRIK